VLGHDLSLTKLSRELPLHVSHCWLSSACALRVPTSPIPKANAVLAETMLRLKKRLVTDRSELWVMIHLLWSVTIYESKYGFFRITQ
jgi:hypothetical protein